LINAGAFWLAEILVAPAPTRAESLGVLAAALGAYCLLAVVAWAALVAWRAGSGWRAAPPRYWLAFLPGAVLLAPRLRYAFEVAPSSAALLLAVLAAAALVLGAGFARAARVGGARFAVCYAAGALALWAIALGAKHIGGDVPLTAAPLAGSLATARLAVGALALVSLLVGLWSRLPLPAVAGCLAVAAVIVLARFLVPAGSAAVPLEHAPADHRPRAAIPVILIVMDTARADHLSVYGYARHTTPALEAFAREAVVFEGALSTSSWTLPAHASLFTGMFPLDHGAVRPAWMQSPDGPLRPGLPLTEEHITLAEWLRDHGYDTGAVMANFGYLDPAFGLDQGFVFYDALPNTPVEPRILGVVHERVAALPWAARFWRPYRSAEQVNRVALDWLASRRSDALFLFLNYMEPHREWTAPGLRHDQFAAEPAPPGSTFRTEPPSPAMRRAIDLYDSQLASLDRALGDFFAGLRRLGLWESSLVIVTSDHGESFGENGVVGHGQSLHAPEVAIPLLVKFPGAARTGREPGRVQLVDLFPTIGTELGIGVPPGLQGDPIGRVDHPILAELDRDPRLPVGRAPAYQATLYEGDRKLIVQDDRQRALFDVARDPAEDHDLAAAEPDTMADERAWLLERYRGHETALRARLESPAPLSPSVKQALQALGYLDEPAAGARP
jgi:arylsulfatase A-like enzyme